MGNNHSLSQHLNGKVHHNDLGRKGSMPIDTKSHRGSISTAANQQPKGMPRSASGADINEKSLTQFVPVEKLAKILQQKTNDEFGLQNGIVEDVFVKYVFPRHPDIGSRLFKFLHMNSKATTKHLGVLAFRQQCERFLSTLDDAVILENFIKMFCDQENPDCITTAGLRILLLTCFNLTMAFYAGAKSCAKIDRTIDSVVTSCFFTKEVLSVGYVARWIEQNCPRLVPPVHRFCLHVLSTAYRGIENSSEANLIIELATPVLDKTDPMNQLAAHGGGTQLMPVSEAWILATALPALYTRPQQVQSPAGSGTNLASAAFMSKMLSMVPSHWSQLYDSQNDGVGANRFLHHVLGYKGPNLTLLRADGDQVFCLASSTEWRETHVYIGGEDSCIIQLLPKFGLLEKNAKTLYLNTSIRGYPKGLRGGSDPKKPLVAVDEHFEKVEVRGIPYPLLSIEVWGCGDKQQREIQQDIKKWQVKEAERQRTVKLTTADWMDHPDRYLLELGGRPQYNNSGN